MAKVYTYPLVLRSIASIIIMKILLSDWIKKLQRNNGMKAGLKNDRRESIRMIRKRC